MRAIGNILWFIFGGFLSGLGWLLSGVMWCISIIGIPYGLQCFKFAKLSFTPFGHEIEYGGGAPSFIVNVMYLPLASGSAAFSSRRLLPLCPLMSALGQAPSFW